MGDGSKTRQCGLPDCPRPHKSHDLCAMHLWRWQRYGDPHHLVRGKGQPCTIDDCGGPHEAKGMCEGHYRAWLRTGDPRNYHGSKAQ